MKALTDNQIKAAIIVAIARIIGAVITGLFTYASRPSENNQSTNANERPRQDSSANHQPSNSDNSNNNNLNSNSAKAQSNQNESNRQSAEDNPTAKDDQLAVLPKALLDEITGSKTMKFRVYWDVDRKTFKQILKEEVVHQTRAGKVLIVESTGEDNDDTVTFNSLRYRVVRDSALRSTFTEIERTKYEDFIYQNAELLRKSLKENSCRIMPVNNGFVV